MFDDDTLLVAYDAKRGEGRGPRKRTATTWPKAWVTSSTALCACRCARPGSISAMACRSTASAAAPVSMPATEVMDKMGYARGLVGYHSERQLQG